MILPSCPSCPSCPSHAIPAPRGSDNFYCTPSHLSQAAPRQPQCQTKKALDTRSWMNDNVIRALCMWGMNHETWCHETPKPRQALDTRSWMENQFVWMHHARNRYWDTGLSRKVTRKANGRNIGVGLWGGLLTVGSRFCSCKVALPNHNHYIFHAQAKKRITTKVQPQPGWRVTTKTKGSTKRPFKIPLRKQRRCL